MADCGAAGSTIDRAAAAAVAAATGNGGQNVVTAATKDVASFLGHASMSTGVKAMPMAPPTAIATTSQGATLVSTNGASGTVQAPLTVAPRVMNGAWNASQPQQPLRHHHPPLVAAHPHAAAHHQRQHMHHQHMHHAMQQQQMQLQMMQQQQMMAQQINQWQQQRQHAAASRASRQEKSDVQEGNQEEVTQHDEDVLESWHEGLEQEVQGDLEEDGVPRGATIEELAKAWAQAEAEYQAEQNEVEDYTNLWSSSTPKDGHYRDGIVDEYQFSDASQEHPTDESIDWMARGMQQFREGQTLEAIGSFETLLRHVDGDNAKAWYMLGQCHAESDEDRKAISCLEQAVDRDPYSTEALLALGVSYVNELNHERALVNLKNWITHNPNYAGMEFVLETKQGESPLEEVERLLQKALDYCVVKNNQDAAADVQEALGVVYNVSRNYTAAVESFRTALELHPDNYQLYNKLGATLANSNQSDLALENYHQALQIKPKYARAWLNMAISHSNLQNYEDAARCYLQTLSLNPSAVHCWSYLRIALSCLERWDLIPLAASQDLQAFREHYEFV